MWSYAIPVVLFAAIAVFFYRGLSLNPGYIPSPLIGKPAPAFSLPSFKDPTRMVTSAELQGQVVAAQRMGYLVRRMSARARVSCSSSRARAASRSTD